MALRMTTWTEYDMDCLEELQWVISVAINPSVARRERLVGLAWTAFAMLGFLVVIAHNGPPLLSALFFVTGLHFGRRMVNVYRSMAKRSYAEMNKDTMRNTYTMEKSHIVAENAQGSAQYPYSQCLQLLETEGRFYVILKSGQGLVLDKSHVAGGNAQDLKQLLESRCGKKAEFLSRRSRRTGSGTGTTPPSRHL